MTNYKRPYFRLFCAVCDTIDALEQTAASKKLPRNHCQTSFRTGEAIAKSHTGNRGTGHWQRFLTLLPALFFRKTLVISAEILYNESYRNLPCGFQFIIKEFLPCTQI